MITTLVAAFAFLAFQDKPEEICGITVVAPKGWLRANNANGTVSMGPAGVAAAVTFIPAQELQGTAAEWHDALWNGVTGQVKVVSASKAATVGAFLVTTGELADAAGTKQWIALYTAASGKRAMAAMYQSTSEDVFKKHADTVRAMMEKASVGGVAPAAAPKGLKNLLDVKVADGWTVNESGGDWTQLLPPNVSGPAEACVALRGGVPIEGSWWASHKKMWDGLRTEFRMKELQPVLQIPNAPGDFIASSGEWGDGGSVTAKVRLYTARAGQSLVAVLWTGQNFGTWTLHTAGLERMLASAVVKGGSPRAIPRIVEAYQCVRMHTAHGLEGSSSKVQVDRIVLFENGLADFSVKHDEGYDAAPLWKMDPELNDPGFGSWKATAREVQITRGGSTSVYTREGDGLRSGGDLWKPMLRVDGLKLSGRFARDREWIEFSADGRFSMANMLWESIVEGQRVMPPAKGTGTYEIRNWTLYLKLDDGFAQSQDFLILEGDVKNPDSIRLRTVMFKREK